MNCAKETLSFEFCEKIVFPDPNITFFPLEKDECYENLGIGLKDINFCEKIKSSPVRKNNCYENLAIHFEDSSLCNKKTAEKNECYTRVLQSRTTN